VFQKGVETLQHQIACFDMSSIIIKPVQRIMKYPLILNELFKVSWENLLAAAFLQPLFPEYGRRSS
jgi:hypothetical protein